FRGSVHGADYLSAAVCDGDLYRSLAWPATASSCALATRPARACSRTATRAVALFDFIRQPVGDHGATQRIRCDVTAAGESMLVPVMPVDRLLHREQVEFALCQLGSALFQRRDVIQHKEPASMRGHYQIMALLDELQIINRGSGKIALDLCPVSAL